MVDIMKAAYDGMALALAKIAQEDGTSVNGIRIPKWVNVDEFNNLTEIKEYIKNRDPVFAQDSDMLQAHGGTYNCHLCSYTYGKNCPNYCPKR